MPSIPQSLLWISLVVLWLFVLVPMLISKRDAVRRTSDVALATRVLNSGESARLLKRGGPATGHISDPEWRPAEEDLDDELDDQEVPAPTRSAMVAAPAATPEPDYLDVDIVEESGALPAGPSVGEASDLERTVVFTLEDLAEDTVDRQDVPEPATEVDAPDDGTEQQYEYVDDAAESQRRAETDRQVSESLAAARRRRNESRYAAAVSARKYKFRKRVLFVMALVMVASASAAFLLSPVAWWILGTAVAVTVLYLGYLRRQTRIEAQLRRRRTQRMARSRLGVENTRDQELDVVPSRLRRPGATVLDIDDEDPIFEHLDYVAAAREYAYPRAAGQ